MRGGSAWQMLREKGAEIRRKDRGRRLGRVPPRGRLDPGLAMIVLAGVVVFALTGGLMALIENANGFFDPPLVRRVEDRRILADYRDGRSPFVDAIMQGRHAVLGRRDGSLHWYDGEQELFSEDSIPRKPALSSDLLALASGCDGAGDEPCRRSDPLFAVTEAGGLAMRRNGLWRVLTSDSAWIGLDGTPVVQEDVGVWVVSGDGRWLLASAGEQGLGLFDQLSGTWAKVSQNGRVTAPDRMVWARGAFWLGGEGGLETLSPEAADRRGEVDGVDGAILDLDVTSAGDVLALQSADCGGATCLSILKATGRGGMARMVGEDSITPGLSQLSVRHAALQSGQIVVLGESGVHAYDPVQRAWRVIEAAPVDALHANAGGRVIYFAAGGRFARLTSARVDLERSVPERIVQIVPTPGGEVLVLDRTGAVYDMSGTNALQLVHPDDGAPKGTRFGAGAFWRDTLILVGSEGVLLHDPARRRYGFMANALPPDLDIRHIRLLPGSSVLWLVDLVAGRVFRGELSGDWPDRRVDFFRRADLGREIVDAQADGDRLILVGRDHTPHVLTATGETPPERLRGAPPPTGFRPVGAVAAGRDLILSDGAKFAVYNLSDRGWSRAFDGPEEGILDMGIAGGDTLLALSPKGTLFAATDKGWEPVVGGPVGASLGLDDVSDAISNGEAIFLGGEGRIVAYRPGDRRFLPAIAGGSGPVRFLAPGITAPLWHSGGKILSGGNLVSRKGERVLAAGHTGQELIYMAETGGRRYAALGHSKQCLFNGADAPKGALIDARALPDGRIIALTRDGAGIYEPANRRWVHLIADGLSPDGHIELLGAHLVVIDGGSFRNIPVADLPSPESCDAGPQAVMWKTEIAAEQVTLDQANGAVYLLQRDGRIDRWQGGMLGRILPVVSTAPDPAALRRVYSGPSGLVFAATNAVWRYNTARRVWSRSEFTGAPKEVSEVDLAIGADDRALVTLWDGDGAAWGGTERDGKVGFKRLRLPDLPRISLAPGDITDIAEGRDFVAILGRDMMELFARNGFARKAVIRLGPAQVGWSLASVIGAAELVLVDGAPDAPERLFVLDAKAVEKGDRTLARIAFEYRPGTDSAWRLGADILWRIDADQALWSCPVEPGDSSPGACEKVRAAPAQIPAPDIRSAISDGESGSFLLLRNQVVHLNRQRRPQGNVPGLKISGNSRLFSFAGAQLFWEGRGGALVELLAAGQTRIVLPGVLDIRRSPNRMAATTGDGFVVLSQTDPGNPAQPTIKNKPVRAATMDDDGEIFGLDETGQPVSSRQNLPDERLLAFPGDTVAVMPGQWQPTGADATHTGWWRQAVDGSVWFEWIETCRRQLPRPGWPDDGLRPYPRKTEETFACRQSRESGVRLAMGRRLLNVAKNTSVPTLVTTEGTWELDRDTLAVTGSTPWANSLKQSAGDVSSTQDMQGRVRNVDGRAYLAPPSFQGNSANNFDVEFGDGTNVLARGGGTLALLSAFRKDWIGWDRVSGQIRFGKDRLLPPTEAFDQGMFLSVVPGRAAYLGGDDYALLNAHGLWRVTSGRSALPVTLAPMQPAVGLTHGRFLLPSGRLAAASGKQETDSDRFTVAIGALELSERLRGGGTSAVYNISGHQVSAYATSGFVFDQRMSVAADRGRAMILTPLGLIPAQSLGDGVAVPARTQGIDTEAGQVLAKRQSGWLRQDATGWTVTDAPRANRTLAEESGRRWQRVKGRAGIVAIDPGQSWRIAARGLDFEADRLIALAVGADGPVIVTGIGTGTARGFAGLEVMAAPVAADPGARRLGSQTVTPGRTVLWAETKRGHLVWDAPAAAWRAPVTEETPWQKRLAVQTSNIRIGFDKARAWADITVTDLNGGTGRVGFAWRRGDQMPFDRVRAFYAEGDKILLASLFGLRRLGGPVAQLVGEALFSGLSTGGPPLGFGRVGRPDSAPTRLLAEAGSHCFELAGINAPPQPCTTRPDTLDTRFVTRDSLWHWRKSDAGVSADYLRRDGSVLRSVPDRAGSGWPHDLVRALAVCSGTKAEVWANAPIVSELRGGRPVALDPLEGVTGLHCQPVPAELGGGAHLAAGLYAFGPLGAWRSDSQGWTATPHAQAVLRRAEGSVPWESARLRVTLENRRTGAEYRWADDTWRTLNWAGGRMLPDRVIGLSAVKNGVQVMTPAGFHAWRVAVGGGFDPSSLKLRTPDDPRGFESCNPATLEQRDGSVQGVPSMPGAPVALVCSDGAAYLGRPDAAVDKGAFKPMDEDIFADRVLIENGIWRWTRKAAGPDSSFSLDISFKGEAIGLTGGRLSPDAYAGLAAPFDNRIEIVTREAGWWRSPARDLGLAAIVRGPEVAKPGEAVALWSDYVEGERRLCVQGKDRLHLDVDDKAVRAGICRDRAGQDTTWSWYTGENGPSAEGESLNGILMQRSLEDGRFADLIVSGAPMIDTNGDAMPILVPTRAGVLKLGALGPEGYYSAPENGWLAKGLDGHVVLITQTGVVPLIGSDRPACPALANLSPRLPEDMAILRAKTLNGLFAHVTLANAGQRVQFLVPCKVLGETLAWTVPVNVSGRGRLNAVRREIGGNLLFMSVSEAGFSVSDGRRGIQTVKTAGQEIIAQLTAPDGRAGLIVTSDTLYRMDADRALGRLARVDSPAFRPDGPFVTPVGPGPVPETTGKANPGTQPPYAPISPESAPVPGLDPKTLPRPQNTPPPETAEPAPNPAPAPAPPLLDNTKPLNLSAAQARIVQKALRVQQLYRGKIDGILGRQSRAGIREWQTRNNFKATGKLTEKQVAVLLEQGT